MDKKHPIDTEWFEAKMAEARLTQEDIARHLRVDRSNVSKALAGKISFNARKAHTWAQLLGVKESDVLEKVGIMTASPPSERDLALKKPHNPDDNELPDSNVRYAPETDPRRIFAAGARDVPIYGTAMCGEDGAFEMNTGEVLEYKPRFDKLTNPRAFGIYAEGDSNEDHISNGDLLFVDPARKPLVGRFALIEMHPTKAGEGPRSFIKRVLAINSEFIRVMQYNPVKEWNIPTKKIKNAYLILKNHEMI